MSAGRLVCMGTPLSSGDAQVDRHALACRGCGLGEDRCLLHALMKVGRVTRALQAGTHTGNEGFYHVPLSGRSGTVGEVRGSLPEKAALELRSGTEQRKCIHSELREQSVQRDRGRGSRMNLRANQGLRSWNVA